MNLVNDLSNKEILKQPTVERKLRLALRELIDKVLIDDVIDEINTTLKQTRGYING